MTLGAAAPGYWMDETSGVLKTAVMAYLEHRPMTSGDVLAMRAYLRQWAAAPAWRGAQAEELRRDVDGISSRSDITAWLNKAEEAGMDPL